MCSACKGMDDKRQMERGREGGGERGVGEREGDREGKCLKMLVLCAVLTL